MSSERMAFKDGLDKGYAKAMDRISALEAENAELKKANEFAGAMADEAETRIRSMREVLSHIAASGIEYDDARLNYVSVQVDRGLWELLQRDWGSV